MKKIRTTLSAIAVILSYAGLNAAAPANYYSSCENKSGAALLTALKNVVGNPSVVSYNGLWDVFKTTDAKSNGKLWDMYSTKEWTPGNDQCGNYKNVGDCYNREHSMPKSWFNDASPMYSDAFHLYPTDGKVNGQRSDYPYGECSKGTTLASNGSVRALGRLGSSTFAGYSGTVFEPDDEYKGDFARSYFYMAAAYNDRISTWDSPMLAGNAYPAFTTWAVELLLKWHRQDPVSAKEIARNDAVYSYQHNRNPFIDNPDMVEHIWGDKKTSGWTSGSAAKAAINTPVNNSTASLGTVSVGVARTYTLNVKGTALKNAVTATITQSENVFSLNTSTLTASAVNSDNGTPLIITAKASKVGTFNGVLKLTSSSDNIDVSVNLTVTVVDGLPVTQPTDISDCSFIAHWVYIGDEDAEGCYTIHVEDMTGRSIDTYPRSVNAKAESCLVDELEPATQYRFYITNVNSTSNVMTVTTAEPIPSIQVLYDGDLLLTSSTGVASEAEELLLDIENIFTDITFSVKAPFQLSSDKASWGNNLVVDPREDRMYIRLLSYEEGTFTTPITAVAGSYVYDNAEVTGLVKDETVFVEDFDNPGQETGNYTSTPYVGNAATWALSNAGVYRAADEAYSGTSYLRLGKNSDSSATMTTDKSGGMGIVTLQAAAWSNKDGSAKVAVDYSSDGGNTWTEAAVLDLPTPSSSTIVYKQYTVGIHCPGNVRLRLRQTYGQRVCIDDIIVSGQSSVEDICFGDEKGHGWDAWCENGMMTVNMEQAANIAIHGVDGVTYVNGHFEAGLHTFSLAPNLYIVVVGQSTRRVLVK